MSSRVDGLRADSRRFRRRSVIARHVRHAYVRATKSIPLTAVAIAASAVMGVVLADSLTVSRSRALIVVYLVAALAATARGGLLGLTQLSVATLPWLIVAGESVPRLTKTFAAGGATALILLVAIPQSDGSKRGFFLRVGIICFYGPVLLSLAGEGYSDQFIQAAKYAVFPAIVIAVTEATNRRGLVSLATVALASGLVAISANLAFKVAGFGGFSDYSASQIVGYGGEHEIALMAGAFTAASLAASSSLRWSPAVAVGAIATVATGVRSPLPGLAMVAIARMVAVGARLRTIVLVALGVVAVFVSGAAAVLEARFRLGASRGEFDSFSALGSGRGEIYTTAIDSWRSAPPIDWFLGTGLRSIPRLEEKLLGSPLVGHSDVIEVGVQLGLIGLLGLILLWWVLVASAPSKAPLVVLGSFAIFNGMLEYSAGLVITVLLSTGIRDAPQGVAPSIGGHLRDADRAESRRSDLAAPREA